MNLNFSKVWMFLFLLAPALFAQEVLSTGPIESALQDELYPLAEQQIWEALSTQRTPDDEAALTVLLMRTLIGEQKFDEAVILADESTTLPKQDALAYWRARALFEKGDFDEVFQALEKFPKQSSYAAAALRMKGRAEQVAGDLKAAQKSFETFRKQFATDENAAQNLLDLADVQLGRGKEDAAADTLHDLLKTFPDDVLADSARLELARQLMASGNKKERAEAAELLQILGSRETAHTRLRIAAWTELAAIEQENDNPALAAEALAKAEALTGETTLRVRQKAARANLFIEEKKNKEAFALFDEAILASPDTALTAEVLIQKAEALLKAGQFAAAEQAFQSYLDVTTTPAEQARALSGKGWSLWEQKRFEEAAIAFESSATKCSQPDQCMIAWLKAGDARLAAGQYEKAQKNYGRAAEKDSRSPQGARAVYQGGVASLLAGKPDKARAQFSQTEANYPDSEFAAQAALQLAELLKREQQWTQALDEYRRVALQYTNSAAQASALNQQGLILYRLGQWDAALDAFRTVSETYPDSPEAPQAMYMRGFCRYLQGDTEAALTLCTGFIEKYPASVWTPDVLFWLGEHYYNRGDYTKAQTTFLDIFTRFPTHDLADDALFWAGTAQLKGAAYLDAFSTFSRLAKEFPQSPLMLKARFSQGEALTELGEFPRAILAYEEVIKNAPDDSLSDRARGRRADCLFTLGASETGRYQEALEAYLALYKRPAPSLEPKLQSFYFALKLQALYKASRCEEKLGLNEKAFAHRMEVVYSAVSQTEPLSPDAILWFTRAALDAAATQEQQQQWIEAVNIYKRIIQVDAPAKVEAQKRIDKIEREYASAF